MIILVRLCLYRLHVFASYWLWVKEELDLLYENILFQTLQHSPIFQFIHCWLGSWNIFPCLFCSPPHFRPSEHISYVIKKSAVWMVKVCLGYVSMSFLFFLVFIYFFYSHLCCALYSIVCWYPLRWQLSRPCVWVFHCSNLAFRSVKCGDFTNATLKLVGMLRSRVESIPETFAYMPCFQNTALT